MKIKDIVYRGHKATICFCDPDEDWGVAKGKFRVDCSYSLGCYANYAEAVAAFNAEVDAFEADCPQTDDEWLVALEACLVWTGYEECHHDRVKTLSLLKKAREQG